MKRKFLLAVVVLVLAVLLVPSKKAFAATGIGLGCGFKFDLGRLAKGQSYHIGQMCILNTGDQAYPAKMNISYFYMQPEMKVPESWVRFEPSEFWLEPCTRLEGGGYICPFDISQKVVQVYLNIPRNAAKGSYFALLEGCSNSGGYIGVCVGSKLLFDIVPGRTNH